MKKKLLIVVGLIAVLIAATTIFDRIPKKDSNPYVLAPSPTSTLPDVAYGGDRINISNPATVEQILGVAQGTTTYDLWGYYSTYEVKMYPLDYEPDRDAEPATTTCSAFTVLEGDVEKYRDAIRRGNTLNRFDGQGNLMLNIDLKQLPIDQQAILLKSNSQAPLSLKIKQRPPGERGAHYCESQIVLISVRE